MSRSSLPANASASLGALRRFISKPKPRQSPVEHCELCHAVLASEHRHLLSLADEQVVCACTACSILFERASVEGSRYRTLSQRYQILPDFSLLDEQWEALMIPVNLLYIFHSTKAQEPLAYYPSPAGAIASVLSVAHWDELVSSNPILHTMLPDVEALLINRVGTAREYYIVPIDCCYQLVGLMRSSWRGLSGGDAVWDAIAAFFATVRTKAAG